MDELIDEAVARELSRVLVVHGVEAGRLRASAREVDGLKLRQRVDLVRDALLSDVEPGYRAIATVVRTAFAENEDLTGWILWPVSEAVVDRALADGSPDDFDDALDLLATLTTRLTSEFAIRPMLNARLERTIAYAERWTRSEDESVRRLASEGTRSHLPWAKGVPELVRRPGVTRAIVDAMYTDESEVVRRSVANHVNDLSRDAPDLAAEVVAGWLARPDDNTRAVARHALRTLVKRGHPHALDLMGFKGADFHVDGPAIAGDQVRLGDVVSFTARVTNTGSEVAYAAIDFVLHFRKARGTLAPKVFKIGTRSIEPGTSVDIVKSYSFRSQTTRTFHPGEHAIELQVNGRPYGRDTFQVLAPDEPSRRLPR